MSSCIFNALKAEKWFSFFFVSQMEGSVFELFFFISFIAAVLCCWAGIEHMEESCLNTVFSIQKCSLSYIFIIRLTFLRLFKTQMGLKETL